MPPKSNKKIPASQPGRVSAVPPEFVPKHALIRSENSVPFGNAAAVRSGD